MASPAVHERHFLKASTLTSYQVMNALRPIDVIKVLNRHSLRFILVGAYGLAGWMKEARATEDVDLVIMTKHHKKAIKALLASFPHLEADDQEVVTRLRDRETKDVAIDLMKQVQPLHRAAFKHVVQARASGQSYLIPTLEFALALKFAPMVSLMRADEKKYMDAHDFMKMVKVNPDIDVDTLAELGNLVYPGGGKEIVEKLQQVRAGKRLEL
jgi:hypothetical protein